MKCQVNGIGLGFGTQVYLTPQLMIFQFFFATFSFICMENNNNMTVIE